ncbi:hypothetical protein GOP47_0017765 [Adiantum capillus-veneris]|uniref:C2 domain-containing protein n=1 Tax=Adiantum capillus-veneris TaxID=13818 RepID=A0A9D4ZAW2_ADICA|nr:hypothetical protein GOP47_0017765 [Adiantum capillus-veneris]
MKKVRREIRFEERRSASQARPLSDFESADWINQALLKIWPQFLEEFISKEVLKPILPWFIDKHKPWTVVMDFFLDFAAAEDMIAILSVQIAKSVGLGITTNIHISRLHIEGKVRVGVKFSKSWPFISRLRLCFENAPYVQMNARPLSTHGVDVSELPLIAGWMERMVADVFEQSLVEPNMLVLDLKKFASCFATSETPDSLMLGKCLHIEERASIATLKLNILEASDLRPADINGLADPYVRGTFNSHRFKTKVQKKTLKPRWFEEFEVPIASWEMPTLLVLRVRDKDQFRDDDLGFCEIDIAKLRDGQHHDLWIPLKDVKMGRIHITLDLIENDPKSSLSSNEAETNMDAADDKSSMAERFEVINLGKGEKDGYWSILSPGQPARTKSWQQRQGTTRHDSRKNQKDNLESTQKKTLVSSSSEASDEEEVEKIKTKRRGFWDRRRHQPSSLSIPSDKNGSVEDADEFLAVGMKGTTVRLKVEDTTTSKPDSVKDLDGNHTLDADISQEADAAPETPSKRAHVKSMAKGLLKHAGKTAHNLGSSFKRKGSTKKAANDEVKDCATSITPFSEPSPLIERKLSMESTPVEENEAMGGADKQTAGSSNLQEEINEARLPIQEGINERRLPIPEGINESRPSNIENCPPSPRTHNVESTNKNEGVSIEDKHTERT